MASTTPDDVACDTSLQSSHPPINLEISWIGNNAGTQTDVNAWSKDFILSSNMFKCAMKICKLMTPDCQTEYDGTFYKLDDTSPWNVQADLYKL